MASFRKKSLLDQAAEYVESARGQMGSAVEQARESLVDLVEVGKPMLVDARVKAGPVLADARDRAVPLIHDARERATPIINDAIRDVRTTAKPYLTDAQSRLAETAAAARVLADAKVAQLKGEPAPKKGGTLKKIAVLGAVATVVGLVAKKLQSGRSNDNWQTSYTPPPAPTGTVAPAAWMPAGVPNGTVAGSATVDDVSGSTPDEALSDATDVPHVATTPDDPADVIDLLVDGAAPEDGPRP